MKISQCLLHLSSLSYLVLCVHHYKFDEWRHLTRQIFAKWSEEVSLPREIIAHRNTPGKTYDHNT